MSAFSENRRRILSLWLPRLPIDRIKRQLADDNDGLDEFPRVVVAKEHNALVLYAIDEAAARSGLSIGLPLANARAICPELTCMTPTRPPIARRWKTSPTGATASRRWWRSMRRMGCFWTSPAAPICSAARRRCCDNLTAR